MPTVYSKISDSTFDKLNAAASKSKKSKSSIIDSALSEYLSPPENHLAAELKAMEKRFREFTVKALEAALSQPPAAPAEPSPFDAASRIE